MFLKKSTFFNYVVSLYMFFKDMDGTVMFNAVEQKPAMNLLFFQRGVGCCRGCGSVNSCKESGSGKPINFKSGTVVFHFFSFSKSGKRSFLNQEQYILLFSEDFAKTASNVVVSLVGRGDAAAGGGPA